MLKNSYKDLLQSGNKGQKILNDLEEEYKFKIYFGFEKFNNFLKIYCDDTDLKEIEKKIKERIKKFKHYSEKISYWGKNLNKVKKLLDDKIASLSKGKMLNYIILSLTRDVLVTSDIASF
jgi:hypothetical protein